MPGPRSNTPATYTTNQFNGIDSFATLVSQNDPRAHTQFHIELLDHVVNDGLVTSDTLVTTPANRYGNDYIAGGAHDDMIFGQLGDDVIQGDGSIDGATVGATRGTTGLLVITPSVESATDGDDYIEGGGGRDVAFGGLGRDDVIGGSSDLFSLLTMDRRPALRRDRKSTRLNSSHELKSRMPSSA